MKTIFEVKIENHFGTITSKWNYKGKEIYINPDYFIRWSKDNPSDNMNAIFEETDTYHCDFMIKNAYNHYVVFNYGIMTHHDIINFFSKALKIDDYKDHFYRVRFKNIF